LLFVPLNFRTKTGEKSTLMAVQFLGTIIFITVKNEMIGQKIIEQFNGVPLKGRRIKVSWSR
ncbi:hypothetical protein JXA32_15645, partial [Candidatus Sumerlaeota bacterium]|nr:hypothetical protein [Candidatus Sumerlaeota bacterium]